MGDNWWEYVAFVDGWSMQEDDGQPTFEDYISVMQSPGSERTHWGGNVELQAAADFYEVNINVLTWRKDPKQKLKMFGLAWYLEWEEGEGAPT
eukprot:SAG31_NODE_11561_length_1017_cov_4.382353_1_plen_93_part_00